MFFPEGQIRVYVYGEPTDMRCSFDGLQALTRHAMGHDPLDGSLYAFINRRATQLRVLYFDRSGFCVWAKRLEAGRFLSDWSAARTAPRSATAAAFSGAGAARAAVSKCSGTGSANTPL